MVIGYVQINAGTQGSLWEGVCYSVVGVMDSCELSYVGSGNEAQVLCKSHGPQTLIFITSCFFS